MNTPDPARSEPFGDPESWQSYVPERVEQPSSIRTAVRLMYVGAVLSGLSMISGFFQKDELREAIRDSDNSLSPQEVDDSANAILAFGVVIGLVAIGLWIWMAITNGQGRSWARIVATVLGGLSIVGSLFNIAVAQSTALGMVFIAIQLVLAIVILVLLYRPDSNRFYDAMAPR